MNRQHPLIFLIAVIFSNFYILNAQFVTQLNTNEIEYYRTRIVGNDGSLDMKKFHYLCIKNNLKTDIIEKLSSFVHISSLEYCELCDDFKAKIESGKKLQKFEKNYYDVYCYKQNPKLNKEIEKFFDQKRCSKNPLQYHWNHDDTLRGTLSSIRQCFDVHYYDLSVNFNIHKKTIKGKVGIYFKMVFASDSMQIDAHRQLNIDKIVDPKGNSLNFKRFNDVIWVHLPQNMQKGNQSIAVEYHAKPTNAQNPPWEGGFVWKKSKGKTWAGVTCEHLGASVWWPCKDHPSDEPDSMRMHYRVPSNLQAIANGNLEKTTQDTIGQTTYHWKIQYPINSYNVTFYLGDFVHFTDSLTNRNGKQYFDYYVLPKNYKKAKEYYKLSNEIIDFYEESFGEFPFKKDQYCLVESPYAGMEHQTAIAIGTSYGKETRYVTAKDDYLIIHEAAHEWWGNSVTAKDMAHAWIQEGFATYTELMFLEHKYGYETYMEEILNKQNGIFNIWPVVGNENVNDNTFVSGDIYDKGALFLHTLRTSINNDPLFFKILKTFATQYKYKMVDTDDFKKVVNELTEKDFTPLFKAYLYQTEVPTLEYSYVFNETTEKPIIKAHWINVPSDFKMPFSLKTHENEFLKFDLGTDWKTFEIESKDNHLAFINSYNGKQCPKNYHSFYYTKMVD
ncbi:MAG: M1 family metallopeptidase [Cytophagales bacterium]